MAGSSPAMTKNQRSHDGFSQSRKSADPCRAGRARAAGLEVLGHRALGPRRLRGDVRRPDRGRSVLRQEGRGTDLGDAIKVIASNGLAISLSVIVGLPAVLAAL